MQQRLAAKESEASQLAAVVKELAWRQAALAAHKTAEATQPLVQDSGAVAAEQAAAIAELRAQLERQEESGSMQSRRSRRQSGLLLRRLPLSLRCGSSCRRRSRRRSSRLSALPSSGLLPRRCRLRARSSGSSRLLCTRHSWPSFVPSWRRRRHSGERLRQHKVGWMAEGWFSMLSACTARERDCCLPTGVALLPTPAKPPSRRRSLSVAHMLTAEPALP